jgi:hypothetical protein
MFFARVKGLLRSVSLVYVSASTMSGWLLNLLWANNFDNALAISFLPAIAGVSYLVNPKEWRWGGVLAGLCIGVLYCYPEMAAAILGGGCLFLLQRFFSEGAMVKKWLLLLLCTVSLTLIVIAPFARDLAWVIRSQFGAVVGSQEVRPGEGLFRDLLVPRYYLLAYWGLGSFWDPVVIGSDLTKKIWYYGESAFALVLSILAMGGIVEILRQRDWALVLTIIFLCIGSLTMVFYFSYSYGAYKFILFNWWGMCFAVIYGSKLLVMRLRVRWFNWEKALFLGLFVFFLFLSPKVVAFYVKMSPYSSILPFKQVEKINELISNGAVLVAVDNDITNEWAVYFLRETPIYISEYKSYMSYPNVLPYMERAKRVEFADIRYMLTDNIETSVFPQAEMMWSGGAYRLWKLANSWIVNSGIYNPNGIENWEGDRGFWLGKGDARIDFISSKNGQVMIEGQFIRGPSLPDKASREMLIFNAQGYQTSVAIIEDGRQTLSLPVSIGKNAIFLRCLDKPTLALLPNGDTRPLLLGVRGLRIVGFEAG